MRAVSAPVRPLRRWRKPVGERQEHVKSKERAYPYRCRYRHERDGAHHGLSGLGTCLAIADLYRLLRLSGNRFIGRGIVWCVPVACRSAGPEEAGRTPQSTAPK